jgi:hypothetical protein
MATFTGTVVVRHYQEITVEAATKEEAEQLMYERFNMAGAVASECQAYDIVDIEKDETC